MVVWKLNKISFTNITMYFHFYSSIYINRFTIIKLTSFVKFIFFIFCSKKKNKNIIP